MVRIVVRKASSLAQAMGKGICKTHGELQLPTSAELSVIIQSCITYLRKKAYTLIGFEGVSRKKIFVLEGAGLTARRAHYQTYLGRCANFKVVKLGEMATCGHMVE